MPVAHWRFTDRFDGDLGDAVEPTVLAARRRALAPGCWTTLHQVHGSQVVTVDEPGAHDGEDADGLVTARTGAVLCVRVADCGPVVLVAEGVVGLAHAGWRGLETGVVEATVGAMRTLGAGEVRAHLGPCIHAECYEFGEPELERLAARLGPDVRAETASGTPALDLPVAATLALREAGVADVEVDPTCTACSDRHWSHRARGDMARQAALVWLAP